MVHCASLEGNPVNNVDPKGLACPAKLKELGACIDSNNFDPKLDCKPNVKADFDSDWVAYNNAKLLDISMTEEHGGLISRTNVFKKVTVAGEATDKGWEGSMPVHSDTKAMMHSHPKGKLYSAAPGFNDIDGIKIGLPNYVTRGGVISSLELVDGQFQFRTIAGMLKESEKIETQKQLNEFQIQSREAKCGCNN
jgi:hypothetical protein